MVQGLVTGLTSVEAREGDEYKERSSRAIDERYIVCSAIGVEGETDRLREAQTGRFLGSESAVDYAGRQLMRVLATGSGSVKTKKEMAVEEQLKRNGRWCLMGA